MRAALFLYAGIVVVVAPLLLKRSWVDRSPRLGILAWQATGVAVVTSLLLVAVLTLSPITRAELDLGHLLHACVEWLDVRDADAADAAAVSLASVLATILSVTCWRALRATRRTRRRQRELVDLVTTPLGTADRERLLEHTTPLAYCIPGGRGRIVVTTGARDVLVDDELTAVIAHERAHLRGRHDLVLLAARVLRSTIPTRAFRTGELETAQLVEMLADDVAASGPARQSLARAVLAMGTTSPRGSLAAGSAPGVAQRRVARLLAQPQQLPGPVRWAVATGATAVAATPWLTTAPALAAALGGCSLPA